MTYAPQPPHGNPSLRGQGGGHIMPVTGDQAPHMRPPAGHGALLLTLQGNFFTAGLTPKVHIDGYQVPGAFGPNFYPLAPGHHRIDIHTQWLRQYGQASMQIDIHEGQTVPGYYAVPWHQFTTGSIGHKQQKRNGLGVMIAMITVIVAAVLIPLVTLMVLLGILAGT